MFPNFWNLWVCIFFIKIIIIPNKSWFPPNPCYSLSILMNFSWISHFHTFYNFWHFLHILQLFALFSTFCTFSLFLHFLRHFALFASFAPPLAKRCLNNGIWGIFEVISHILHILAIFTKKACCDSLLSIFSENELF